MITLRLDGTEIVEERLVDQIRCLGIDMIDAAQSGHPGIVLGAAPILYTLYAHHLRYSNKHPDFFSRDRFVMSAGHGSALLYSTLYMAGFDLTLDDLKAFRKIGSKTPGHPEYGVTPGVDATTGPLGQGIATAVGMAIAEKKLHLKFPFVDYYTYVLCGDGDLMEGISYEACSLAGTLGLEKLIVLYDSNQICLDGKTSQTFRENVEMRFISQGWNVIFVEDGESIEAISKAIDEAKKSTDKPTLIEVRTTIGKYSKNQGTNKVHGSPLSKEDISSIKETLKVRDIPFSISQISIDDFAFITSKRCQNLYEDYEKQVEALSEEDLKIYQAFVSSDKTVNMRDFIYEVLDEKKESPRVTSSRLLNKIVPSSPLLLGGAADLFGANKTYIEEGGDFSQKNLSGQNLFFGVREHAMGAILNGLALCGFRPYGSTFLAFSDYLRPSIRLACMLNLPVIYIFTHDSISVGEDGPTHQPIEQLLGLRSLPNMDVFRPCDANEVIGSYKVIFSKSFGPSSICLSRNTLPILENTKINEVENGGYIVKDTIDKPDGILIATGEEVHLAISVSERLESKGIYTRVVSMPNLNRFLNQSSEYIESILPVEVRKIVIEAGSPIPWSRIVFHPKYIIGIDSFGLSGNYKDVYDAFGFSVEKLESVCENLLK